jgi:uncharacterized membrane protein YphA (DoxX/SURF4 family)
VKKAEAYQHMKTAQDGASRSIFSWFSLSTMERLVRWAIAAIFIYSGLIKLMDPSSFAVVISGFGLVPKPFLFPAALFMSSLELIAGIGLMFAVRGSLSVITAMLLMFIAVLVYGIHLGLDIDCGCFGPEDPEQAYKGLKAALVRDAVMMVALVFIYWGRARTQRGPVV